MVDKITTSDSFNKRTEIAVPKVDNVDAAQNETRRKEAEADKATGPGKYFDTDVKANQATLTGTVDADASQEEADIAAGLKTVPSVDSIHGKVWQLRRLLDEVSKAAMALPNSENLAEFTLKLGHVKRSLDNMDVS